MSYDALVIAAHPDDAETQMGGTLARLADAGQRILLIDLTDGEPTEFAEPGVRAEQAAQASWASSATRSGCATDCSRTLQKSGWSSPD